MHQWHARVPESLAKAIFQIGPERIAWGKTLFQATNRIAYSLH
jgi:hypothetical protein